MNVIPISIPDRREIVLEQTEQTENNPKFRDPERASAAALAYFLSPVHTLPVELLVDIFNLAVDEWTHIHDALRISQVCSHWRRIAHGTPRLWTGHIRVCLESRSDSRIQTYVDGLKAWLARSAPFSVPVSFMLGRGDVDHHLLGEVLSAAPRWRSLDLRMPKDPPLSLVRQLAQCRLDTLEELNLGMNRFENDITQHDEPAAISFTNLPRLRKLSICIFSDDASILMPWSQLTDLTLLSDSPDIALGILAQSSNLTRASVRTMGWSADPGAGRTIVTLDHLRTLSLPFWGWEGPFSRLFDYLSVPTLEEFRLNALNVLTPDAWSEARFTAFQLRASSITRLNLSYVSLTAEGLRAAIDHAPLLAQLQLNCCHPCLDDVLLGALTYKGTTGTLAPRLHHLVLEYMGRNSFTEDILAEMIASRWWADDAEPVSSTIARWTHVELVGDFGQHFMDTMQDLRRKGLDAECRL
ncbi:F-box domain-containing protein [Mycena sanguinolenta]|uniref:F-box domain-containing protein n=1 Tax=Mycena sanguinolenta TaxID=230812 RepID=A0A8H6YEE7_9AGAR|nr:F-box domain-containing protein [Mycena sanguinolenta]